MGNEAQVTASFNGTTASGKARLETAVLQFRGGDLKLSIPFAEMSRVAARGGTLRVTFPGGTAAFELGDAAPKWADKILHPPSRLQKIGVKPEWRAAAMGTHDPTFLKELEAGVSDLSIGRASKNCDAIFVAVTKEAELSRLGKLKASLKPNGALWV